jgi:hypothetical protein
MTGGVGTFRPTGTRGFDDRAIEFGMGPMSSKVKTTSTTARNECFTRPSPCSDE